MSLRAMEIRFDDDDLDRLETDARFTVGFPPAVVKAFRRRMQQMRAAHDQRDFRANKSWNFKKRPDRPGEFSVRLNDQFRIMLSFDGAGSRQTIVILAVGDFH